MRLGLVKIVLILIVITPYFTGNNTIILQREITPDIISFCCHNSSYTAFFGKKTPVYILTNFETITP